MKTRSCKPDCAFKDFVSEPQPWILREQQTIANRCLWHTKTCFVIERAAGTVGVSKEWFCWLPGEMTGVSILHWWGNPASFPANKIEVSGNKGEPICTHSNIIGLTLRCPSEHALVSGQKLPANSWHCERLALWVSTPHHVNIQAICKNLWNVVLRCSKCTHCSKQEDIHVASEFCFFLYER